MVCLRNICISVLHQGDGDDNNDSDDDDNNNNNTESTAVLNLKPERFKRNTRKEACDKRQKRYFTIIIIIIKHFAYNERYLLG
jgi:hypothetical protein